MSEPAKNAKKTCRVYVVHHDNGCFTAILMRQWNVFFDKPAPSAYARTLDDALAALDVELAQRAAGNEPLERYLWSETFEMRSVTIEVRPQTFVDKRPVIGARAFPLTLQYAACQLKGGAWRVGLPRFGWWMVLESLELAKDALETAIGAALLGEQEKLVFEFRREGRETVREWTSRLVDLGDDDDADEVPLTESHPTMCQVADELVSRARARKLTGTFGNWRNVLEHRVQYAYSTLLVGPSGVGKSARVRQFAKLLAQRRNDKTIDPRRLWHTSKDRILAGMMYLGQWEERVLAMVAELSVSGDWLYVERMSDLLEPVGASGGSIGELLLPAIQAKEIYLISEATREERDRLVRRFPAWWDALSTIWITPPDDAALAAWIPGFTESLELKANRTRGTPWERPALRRLMQLQARFEPARAQPGAAVRFVDWWVRTSSPTPTIDSDVITDAYARYSGLPVDMVSDRVTTTADTLKASLDRRVIGQPDATAIAANVIARFKAGLSDPQRPIATLLFIGPTGTGKTELAKAMCQRMFGADDKLIRVDMSEYHLPWSAHRLFAVGEGNSGTSLAERVRRQPISLVLLDEIEKAHPSIFDVLMAVLDEGRFTDERGETVDFRTTLIVMTSNLGAGGPRATGFNAGAGADYFGAARRWFRPELLNRIDHVIPFGNLTRTSIDSIVALELARIVKREGLDRRNLTLNVSASLRDRLATEGYHPEYGARALRRVLEERLVVPLAALVAASPELRDLTLVADLAGDIVTFQPVA